VDTRVFLIHLFKLLVQAIDESSKNPVPQWIASIAQELPVMEKPPASRILRGYPVEGDATNIFIPLNAERRISLTKKQLLSPFYTFYSAALACRLPKDVPQRLYELAITEPELQSFFKHAFLQARHADIALDALSHYNDRENSATDAPSPDKEVDMPPGEREPGQGVDEVEDKEVEKACSEALKKISLSTKGFAASNAIPAEKKVNDIKKTEVLVHDIFEACQNSLPFEEALQQIVQSPHPKEGEIFHYQPKQEKALQPPDLSEIPLYQGRRGRQKQGSPPKVKPLDFLKTHYGQWLSSFGAAEDSVFQEHIRGHDHKLMEGLRSQLHHEGKGRKVSDLVKTRSARVDRELEGINSSNLKRAERLSVAKRRRQARAQAASKASRG
jgi:hypothetical protein